ncbi:hypothetical protein FS749_005419 [Ceratobasidium sp. UAMH 11750]|nr:hypothetical protein FS749_005419 [Ceratobasidium sp. UAMH 11750]
MRSSVAGALALFLSARSISALDVPPNHAPPEMLVIPPNVTIMTPRTRNSAFENQIIDFGSAQNGFSELRHILQRQACSTGYGSCPNDPGICCPIGGRCCGNSKCCGAGRWCYGGGCCLNTQNGCDDQGCCAKSAQCCKGGSCCESGKSCVIINGKLGCCPIGQTCTGPPTCQDSSYSLCPDEKFCCPTGYQCYRDAAGNPLCRNPNPPPPTSSDPPEPSTTYVPPPPPPTTEQETSTYVPPPPPPPDTRTVVIQTTQTQVVTQTYQVTQTSWPTQPPQQTRTFPPSSSSPSRGTTSQAVQTGAVLGSETKTSVGAIAGGVVAGVVAVVVLILALVFWRRRQAKQAAATNVQPPPPPPPPNTVPPNPNPFISTGAVPPTPNSGDPFLTPMGQHQNLGVSYFNGVPASTNPPSGSNSGTGPYNASHYSGLPEPQQNEMSGEQQLPAERVDSGE